MSLKERIHAFRFPHAKKVAIVAQLPKDTALYHVSQLRRRPTIHHPHESPPARGMWVVCEQPGMVGVGILTQLEPNDMAHVMLVDNDGVNRVEKPITVAASLLRQAWLDEIPLKRRPTEEVGAAMGYHKRSA